MRPEDAWFACMHGVVPISLQSGGAAVGLCGRLQLFGNAGWVSPAEEGVAPARVWPELLQQLGLGRHKSRTLSGFAGFMHGLHTPHTPHALELCVHVWDVSMPPTRAWARAGAAAGRLGAGAEGMKGGRVRSW